MSIGALQSGGRPASGGVEQAEVRAGILPHNPGDPVQEVFSGLDLPDMLNFQGAHHIEAPPNRRTPADDHQRQVDAARTSPLADRDGLHLVRPLAHQPAVLHRLAVAQEARRVLDPGEVRRLGEVLAADAELRSVLEGDHHLGVGVGGEGETLAV